MTPYCLHSGPFDYGTLFVGVHTIARDTVRLTNIAMHDIASNQQSIPILFNMNAR